MKLAGEYLFNGPRAVVWEVLQDPEVLAKALPGMKSLTLVEENVYEGEMNVRVGPVAGLFAGKLTLSDLDPPESYTMTVDGKGAPGFVHGSGDCTLIAQEPDKTLMQYDGELQVGGTIANVGQRLVETVANSLIKQAFQSLNRSLEARLAAGDAVEAETDAAEPAAEKAAGDEKPAPAAVEYEAPSQVQVAAGVAKDVVAEYLSSEDKTVWTAVAAALLGVIVGFWLGRVGR